MCREACEELIQASGPFVRAARRMARGRLPVAQGVPRTGRPEPAVDQPFVLEVMALASHASMEPEPAVETRAGRASAAALAWKPVARADRQEMPKNAPAAKRKVCREPMVPVKVKARQEPMALADFPSIEAIAV